MPMYNSIMLLSADHDVGFAMMAAGNNGNHMRTRLADIVSNMLLPMVEQAARQEAAAAFAGIYADTPTDSSIVISTDPDRPGLGIKNWLSNGVDMKASITSTMRLEDASLLHLTLYPIGLRQGKKVAFRANFQPGGTGKGLAGCATWVALDGNTFGATGLDDFVIEVDEKGNAVSISPRVLKVTLEKVKEQRKLAIEHA